MFVKRIIHVGIFRGDQQYEAECLDLPRARVLSDHDVLEILRAFGFVVASRYDGCATATTGALMNVLVIGGTLFIGRHLVEALQAAGHDVTILHRNPKPGSGLIADRNDPESVRAALKGRQFDAVFDNVYDWQRGTTASQVEATARACAGNRLQRYVFMSSVAAYGSGLDRREDDPLAPVDYSEDYVRNKANSERALFRMHEEEGFPAVTLRPPFVYGPGNPIYREAFFWDRLRDERPIIVPDDGSRWMHFVYVHDIVWCCLRILNEPAAPGQAFNVADPAPITQEQLVQAFAKVAGREPRIVHLPRESALAAGGHPMGPKLYFAVYYDLPPITERIDKARDLLGLVPTPFDTGLQKTYEWWLDHNPFSPPDYGFENELLAHANLG
jgi:2'-hydroxyisoflavone reductase